MKYEKIRRKKHFHYGKHQDNFVDYIQRYGGLGVRKLGQGSKLAHRSIGVHAMKYGFVIFLISVWFSGWFANARTDMKFESLLVLVVGTLILVASAVIGGGKGKRK